MALFNTRKNSLLSRLKDVFGSKTFQSLAKPLGEAILAQAAIPSLVEKGVNYILNKLPGYRGHIERLELSLLHPGFTLHGLHLDKISSDHQPAPFLRVDTLHVRAGWKALLDRSLVGDIEVDHPVLFINASSDAAARMTMAPPSESWQQKVRKALPFQITRLLVRRGEVHFTHIPHQGKIDLSISDMFIVIKNITNSIHLAPSMDAEFECRAEVMRSGRLYFEGKAYPFSETPTVDVNLQLRSLDLAPLNPLFETYLGTDLRSGTLDLVAEAAAGQGGIRGYVKPLLQRLSFQTVSYQGLWDRLKGAFIHRLTRWIKNTETDRIATKITFESDFQDVHIDYIGAITRFLKNAFQTALRPTLEHSIQFARAGVNDAAVEIHYSHLPRTRIQKLIRLLKDSATRWSDDNASRLSAALAYYTIFSIAPLLILVIAVVGLAFGRKAAQGDIVNQLSSLVGHNSAAAIQSMIQAAWKPAKGILATVISVVTLLSGAMGVLTELKDGLNKVWRHVPLSGFGTLIKTRLASLGLILGIGFLLMVSLVVSAVIAAIGKYLNGILPVPELVLHTVNFLVSFGVITGLFAMLYKFLPDTAVSWHDVWIGSAVTSLLFSIGKMALGLYLGKSSVSSSYGAAGSVLIFLLWVYYSAMILYYGAEYTAVYATTYGSRAP